MAKIDTSKIPGYAEMSAEDKLKALEGFEYEDNAAEVERLKNANSKLSSESAEYKRKLREKQTDDEAKAQKEAEEKEALIKQNKELQEKVSVSENTAQLIALGYDEALAAETAKAMFDGDTAKVFANQKKHQDGLKKKFEKEALDHTPTPPAGDGKVTAEAFAKMTLTEKAKLKLSDPELFKALDSIKES